jgi:hypothetical protein
MSSSELTHEQIFEFYHTRLTEIMTQHNPAALNTIEALLKQFPGKEHAVYKQICKKFSVDPVNPPALDDFENGKVKPQQKEPRDERVAKWLTENGFGKHANKHHFQTMSWEDFLSISTKGRLIELGVLPNDATLLLNAILLENAGDGTTDTPIEEKKADFDGGENCYTKVLTSGKGGEKWLNAKVTNVNCDNSFDIFVYNSKSFNVPPEAVNVPRSMLKKLSEDVKVAVPRKAPKRPQFLSGDRVKVFGLRSHTTYNGLYGTVLLYVASERRYQVRLDTNDVIAIKQRNVGPVSDDDKEGAAAQGKKKVKKSGSVEKDDETILSELMTKLMQDNPNTDPGKLGEFAAGYLLAKRKMNANSEN